MTPSQRPQPAVDITRVIFSSRAQDAQGSQVERRCEDRDQLDLILPN